MAIGVNRSRARFGTWIDHSITEERQTWATNFYWKVELDDGRQLPGDSNNNENDFR